MTRRVVLLMGPPGAGKSTLAEDIAGANGLVVLDRDAFPFNGDEDAFRAACAALGRMVDAQAVVIRTGSSSAARHTIRRLIQPTEEITLSVPLEVCLQRIHDRARGTADEIQQQLNGARSWWLQRGGLR